MAETQDWEVDKKRDKGCSAGSREIVIRGTFSARNVRDLHVQVKF